MHTGREYLLRRIAVLDTLVEHMQLDAAGDRNEFKTAIEGLRADDIRRLNDLDDAEEAI